MGPRDTARLNLWLHDISTPAVALPYDHRPPGSEWAEEQQPVPGLEFVLARLLVHIPETFGLHVRRAMRSRSAAEP